MSRWRLCPGSVKLIKQMVAEGRLKDSSSFAAAEGTVAHHFAAEALANDAAAWEYAGEEMHEAEWDFVVDHEMVEGIQLYLDTVLGDYQEGNQIYVEHGIEMGDLFPGLYGTLDAGLSASSILRVYDFKYGKGIRVEPEENDQFLYYAAGLMHSIGDRCPEVEEIELIVVQPRIAHANGPVRRWRITVQSLGEWVEAVLLPAARRTEGDIVEGDFQDGEHCRFCPAAAECPLRRERAIGLFNQLEESIPDEKSIAALEDWELGEQIALKLNVMAYFADLSKEAMSRAMKGTKVPGQKLVEQIRQRIWKDGAEEEAVKTFKGKAYTKKLLSPAQLEKVKGGKEFVAEHAFKPDGGLTLVSISDKRKEIEVQDVDPNKAFANL
jgi:hypothetical protein